ncbi:MAG: phosphoglycerate mutase [Xanthomonadales bacterium]|nr:phosphoglycerate mutase [Xanthomonadales bacterium]
MINSVERENRARTVWLIRHANAADAEPGQKDIDRPLTRRGERQCAQMKDWLARRMSGPAAPTALVSPSARARRTAELALGDEFGERHEEPRIWNATAAMLAALVQEHSGDLLLVGHNPGLEQVQASLTGQLMPLSTGGIFELEFGDQGRVRLAARFEPDA